MTVHFIGAGPGAADLITVRGLRLIESCPVCLYAGSLVPHEIVAAAPSNARVIDTEKYTEEGISTEYLNKYLLRDFERVFRESPFEWTMHALPFGSKYARWTKVFLETPWIREFITGYIWVVLERDPQESVSTARRSS